MHASAKTMLRETKTKRHRCEFADSVDSKSKRRKRAQQHRLQERMLQVNRQGDWRDVVVRVGPKVHLPERRINRCFSKSIAEGIRCGPTKELRLNPTRILKQRNLIRDADITRQILCEKVKKKHWRFLNSLLTEGIGCGPTRELRLKPTRILKQGNLIKETQKTKKKCEQIAKKLLDFLAHHGCVGFQEKQ